METKEKESGSTKFIVFLLSIPASIYGGLVFSKLWMWFISSTFDIIEISIVQAIGLSLVTDYIKGVNIVSEEENLVEKFIYQLVCISIFWGMGAIVNLFM